MHYEPFAMDTQPSCKDPSPAQDDDAPVSEGCVCDDGYILDNGLENCNLEENCGCLANGEYYPVSKTFLTYETEFSSAGKSRFVHGLR